MNGFVICSLSKKSVNAESASRLRTFKEGSTECITNLLFTVSPDRLQMLLLATVMQQGVIVTHMQIQNIQNAQGMDMKQVFPFPPSYVIFNVLSSSNMKKKNISFAKQDISFAKEGSKRKNTSLLTTNGHYIAHQAHDVVTTTY